MRCARGNPQSDARAKHVRTTRCLRGSRNKCKDNAMYRALRGRPGKAQEEPQPEPTLDTLRAQGLFRLREGSENDNSNNTKHKRQTIATHMRHQRNMTTEQSNTLNSSEPHLKSHPRSSSEDPSGVEVFRPPGGLQWRSFELPRASEEIGGSPSGPLGPGVEVRRAPWGVG